MKKSRGVSYLLSGAFLLTTILLIYSFSNLKKELKLNESDSITTKVDTKNMKRYGNVIKVKPERLGYYKQLHAKPWPEVIKAINECNVRNFSIYYKEGYLFSYYEYIGDDYTADMKKLSELTKEWLKETDPCQVPVETAKEGEWWSEMEEVFHTN